MTNVVLYVYYIRRTTSKHHEHHHRNTYHKTNRKCGMTAPSQLPLAITLSARAVVLVPGRWYPRLAIDLEQRMDGWWSSLACMDDGGGMELWRGPYGNPEAAERNAAAYGRQFCRARGLARHADFLTRHYGFRSHP